MKMVFKRITLLAAWMTLAITGFADILQLKNGRQISGTFEGGTSRIVRFRSDSGVQEYDIFTLSAVLISSTSTITNVGSEKARNTPEYSDSFGPGQERLIREWFSTQSNYSSLPPGLAKRDKLPPGLQRQLQRNGTLPPGLQKRVQPLPLALEQQLPPITVGMRRVVLSGNVILLEVATARIVDLIRDVF
jgi:hypothetical protein